MAARLCLAIFGCWLAIIAPSLYAAELKAKPVTIELGEKTSVETLELENSGAAPVRVQLRLFSWTQAGRQDQLEPTRDIVANPGIFEISPGSAQTIRIGRLIGPASAEKSYRLFIDQIPDNRPADGGEVKVLLRLSLPIFVAPSNASSQLEWRIWPAGPNRLAVAITNNGNAHAKLHSVQVSTASGDKGKYEGLLYVLPGATRSISLPIDMKVMIGQQIKIVAGTDNGDSSAEPKIEAAPHAESLD
ncbi:MAG: molecular chaperone [Thermomicrobiales bacterium]